MKDWNPRIVPGARRRRTRLPAAWKAYRPRSRWRPSAGEVRLTVLGGLFAGLLAAFGLSSWTAPAPDAAPSPRVASQADPYAEAARSRAILEAQEGRPAPLAFANASTRVPPTAARVIDGDTFDYGGMRVRVADIDTPEVDGRCPRETQLAARATRRMRALLAAAPFELSRLPNGRDEDRYGRKLRIVTRGGRSLGDQLVAEGLARTWTGRREPWC